MGSRGSALLAVCLAVGLAAAAPAPALADDGCTLPAPRRCAPAACDPCGWDDPRRGPVEVRDEFLLAQRRLTLPSISPDTLACGRATARVSFAWFNTFAGDHRRAGNPPDGGAFVDGETATLDLTLRYGLRPDVDVAVRVPVHVRGGGVLDPAAEWVHQVTGTGTGGRDDVPEGDYTVRGTSESGDFFEWDDGTGLGAVELESRWRFCDGGRDRVSAALVGRVALPTGTGAFSNDGVGVGLQVVAAARLWRDVDVYAGVGGTWESNDEIDGLTFEPFRGHVFWAIEWRPWRRWSFVFEQSVTTPIADDLQELSRPCWYMRLTAKIDLSPRTRFEIGLAENVFHMDAGADYGGQMSLTLGL